MQLSEGVEWAIHACTLLGSVPEGQVVPAARLAEFAAGHEARLAPPPASLPTPTATVGGGHGR